MKKRTKVEKEFDKLTNKEKRIYLAVKKSFPATSHLKCLDVAIQGGVNYQFYQK